MKGHVVFQNKNARFFQHFEPTLLIQVRLKTDIMNRVFVTSQFLGSFGSLLLEILFNCTPADIRAQVSGIHFVECNYEISAAIIFLNSSF